jgi:hypothetical protein
LKNLRKTQLHTGKTSPGKSNLQVFWAIQRLIASMDAFFKQSLAGDIETLTADLRKLLTFIITCSALAVSGVEDFLGLKSKL